MYRQAMQELGIDQSQLPVSALTKDTIQKAHGVLENLCKTLNELEELRGTRRGFAFSTGRTDVDFSKSFEIFSRLGDLTSEFYQLIPMRETDYWSVRPVTHINQTQGLR